MADRDGFDAVTLRRIAAELDVHVTSLYNHVPTRDAITDGIVERLVEEAKLATAPVGWETWVRSFVTAIETVAATHPGAFTALHRRPVQGPRAAASFELALAAFSAAGFTAEEAFGAVKATMFTALTIGVERAMLSRDELPETALDELPIEDFPHSHASAQVGDPEATWAFAVETLVAGLRAQLRQRKRLPH
jgi:AcrR family transcriptional regulator